MNANGLLKWLVPAALFAAALILFKGWLWDKPTATPTYAKRQDMTLSAEQARALGIDGDTPRDTVATLVGQVKAMRSELVGMKQANEHLQDENRRLRARESGVDSRISSALNGVTEKASADRRQADEARRKAEEDNRQARSLLQQMEAQLAVLTSKGADLPVGLGLQPGDGEQFDGGDPSSGNTLLWIEPADSTSRPKEATEVGTTTPSGFKALQALTDNIRDRAQVPLRVVTQGEQDLGVAESSRAAPRPVYTLPQNATLIGSVAMTALIGRVPVDGTVNDPYPFKILIGPDNLAANGLDLPEVAGAVMSGTATGDWTLACVRGQVESITFVFQDGTLRTVPEPPEQVGRNAPNTSSSHEKIRGGLGYLSDPNGIPCIAGQRRSNAQQYLGSQSLVTAAGAGVAALLGGKERGGVGVISGADGTIGLHTSPGNSSLHQILSSGVGDIRAWVGKLYGEAFAAVYVPPAAKVAVHLDQQITFDYAPQGRRLNHEQTAAHRVELD